MTSAAKKQAEDPVWDAFLSAPLDDEPETDEELEAIELGRLAIAEGRYVTGEELAARLRRP